MPHSRTRLETTSRGTAKLMTVSRPHGSQVRNFSASCCLVMYFFGSCLNRNTFRSDFVLVLFKLFSSVWSLVAFVVNLQGVKMRAWV